MCKKPCPKQEVSGMITACLVLGLDTEVSFVSTFTNLLMIILITMIMLGLSTVLLFCINIVDNEGYISRVSCVVFLSVLIKAFPFLLLISQYKSFATCIRLSVGACFVSILI